MSCNVWIILTWPDDLELTCFLFVAMQGYIRTALLELVQSNSPIMTSNLYGRKVLTFCQKELNINFRTR